MSERETTEFKIDKETYGLITRYKLDVVKILKEHVHRLKSS